MNADLIMSWMFSTGLDISILIAFILIFRRPFRRMFGAGAAYALWLLPLFRVFLPEFHITLPRPDWLSAPTTYAPEIIEFSAALPVTSAPVADPINWQLPSLILWGGVAIFWLFQQVRKQRQYLSSALRKSAPVSNEVLRKLKSASNQLNLNKCPQVRLASNNMGPLVTGVANPVIILPHNFETDFTDRQQSLALTHELAHIKRHDLMAAFGTLIFRALNWPNPLVHIAAAQFRADQEAACDAYVLKMVGGGQPTKQSYAETLIHSARLSRHATGSMDSSVTNPLCLTIHHPLKERLMTMKTTKTPSAILSRVGVAAFLAAGLAVTAPITIASAQDDPTVETKMKKVLKWVENENGVETTKTYEIVKENGVKTVYSIDEHGNKTLVSEDELGDMPMMGGDIEFMVLGDGEAGEKNIKIIGDGDLHAMGDGQHGKVMIKRMKKSADGQEVDVDKNVFVFKGEGDTGSHASAMVSAAKQLLDQVDSMENGDELSARAQRKLEKARKALDEAQEALDAE